MRLILVIAALLLASCTPNAKPHITAELVASPTKHHGEMGPDYHWFERKQFNRTEFRVRIVYYDDLRTLARVYQNFGGSHGGTIYAFQVDRSGVCEIHTIDPMKWYAPQYIGHELFHCAHGSFHD
jgi:hypothetical protein